MAMIEIENLNRYFGEGDNQVHILKDVNLSIEKGDFIAIIGQSGSGKSTLMNIIGCLDKPTDGTYRIDNEHIENMNDDELAALRRQKFGFIFQRYNLLSSLSAAENVALPAVYAGVPDAKRQQRAKELLGHLGLDDKTTNKPNELSGGQQQRVSIARALMNGGEIILADEPTGALDSKSGEMVMEILQDLHRKGHTLILVTHDPKIAQFANRVIEIKDGEIISDVSKKEVIAPELPKVAVPKHSLAFYKDQFIESFRMSVQAIIAHKLRSLLTMLGIIIGIASVVSVVALGKGSQEKILEQINAMGTNTITIYPGASFGDARSGRVKSLTIDDIRILNRQGYLDGTTPSVTAGGTLVYANINANANLSGVGELYNNVYGLKVEQGRFIDGEDIKNNASVAVIDQNTIQELFPNGDNPLGQVILFKGRPLTIVGVLAQQDSPVIRGNSLNIWSPYTTVMNKITGDRFISSIIVKVKEGISPTLAEENLTDLIKMKHGRKDFFTFNSDSIRQAVESTTAVMRLLITSIAMISLIVGGIGVMNIMLVSVTERTKEIGVRMAIGARQNNILSQFLIEAILICIIGGLVGVGLSFLIGWGFNSVSPDFKLSFSTASIILALSCSTLIGVLFGFMPAKNASKLNPIEALSRD